MILNYIASTPSCDKLGKFLSALIMHSPHNSKEIIRNTTGIAFEILKNSQPFCNTCRSLPKQPDQDPPSMMQKLQPDSSNPIPRNASTKKIWITPGQTLSNEIINFSLMDELKVCEASICPLKHPIYHYHGEWTWQCTQEKSKWEQMEVGIQTHNHYCYVWGKGMNLIKSHGNLIINNRNKSIFIINGSPELFPDVHLTTGLTH